CALRTPREDGVSPAPATRVNRIYRDEPGKSRGSRSQIPIELLPGLFGRGTAPHHFAGHPEPVGEFEVTADVEVPVRAGAVEQRLLLALVVGPGFVDREFGEAERSLAPDDRRDFYFDVGPVEALRLLQQPGGDEGRRRRHVGVDVEDEKRRLPLR